MISNRKQELNGNNNLQAQRDIIINYCQLAKEDQLDQGIIEEIFEFVKNNVKEVNDNKAKPDVLIKIGRKIKRNFKKVSEQRDVKTFFMYAFTKTALIEKKFSELDSDEQNDIHSYIYGKYIDNRNKGFSNIENLQDLFFHFIPKNRNNNPQYNNISKAFVLFFFGDCTIFEKIKEEKQMVIDFQAHDTTNKTR